VKISGRVVIDAHAFYLCQGEDAPELKRNEEGELAAAAAAKSREQADEEKPPPQSSPASEERHEELRTLTDPECMLAVARVRGFDLGTKEWCKYPHTQTPT
jgi:hypothetical protein